MPAVANAQQADDKASNPIKVPSGDFAELKHTSSDRIDKIIDGLTILMKSGKIIRLSSIDIPDFQVWENAEYSVQAMEALETLLPEKTEVMIYQTRSAKKGRLNRMKQHMAHIVVKKDMAWVQGHLIAHGIARVNHDANAPEMAEQMLQNEGQARAKDRGFWGKDSRYRELTPLETEQDIGEFVVVRGTVKKVASVKNNIYLNFGDNWKTDFTVMITPALRKKLAKQAANLQSLAGKEVRVRGWLREYNGPLIELNNIKHIEFITTPADKPLPSTE